jgi:hypothetical protein
MLSFVILSGAKDLGQISLTARLAVTPSAAYELGFDVAAWARERLIDGIADGAFLNTQWLIPVDEFRNLVGRDVAVYACTDYSADRRPGLPVRALPIDHLLLRGFAAGHLATAPGQAVRGRGRSRRMKYKEAVGPRSKSGSSS